MADEDWDVRTTPRVLQIPLALLFLATIVYVFIAFQGTMTKTHTNRWTQFGLWKMFTVKARKQAYVEFEVQKGGQWVELDPQSLFPTRWESGLRFERRSFRQSKRRLRVLAASACYRSDEPIEAIKIVEVRYRVRPHKKPYNHERVELHSQKCTQSVRLPNGRVLDPVAWREREGR